MDNPSLSRKSPNASEFSIDDIPEAVRDTPQNDGPPSQSKRKWLVWRLVGLGAIAFVASLWLHFQSNPILLSAPSRPTPEESSVVATSPSPSPTASATSPTPASSKIPATGPSTLALQEPDSLLGHLPYEEAPASELQSITSDGGIKLRKPAAVKYQEMTNAAASEGISLVPISGFRSLEDQQHIFFDVKAERGQDATKRAEVSAPPGYSEHHTGYAVDIGDANSPSTNLNPNFENTTAFKWLEANAPFFSFELSFPKNNSQGVSYEPWHWRYVGDRHSLETFYKAHSLKK